MNPKQRLATVLPLLGCLLLASCDSGGGGGPVEVTFQFSQAGNCTGAEPNLLTLSRGKVNQAAGTVQLFVDASFADPVLGAAFHVSYNPKVLKFVKFVPNAIFMAGGVAEAQRLKDLPGTVAVGVTRLGGTPGASGTHSLGHLVFSRKVDFGTTAISFSDELLADAQSSFPTPLAACWADGQLKIRPK